MSRKKPNRKRCHKVEYRTEEDARIALNVYGKARGCKRFYRCPHHGEREVWHLTSESKPKRKR